MKYIFWGFLFTFLISSLSFLQSILIFENIKFSQIPTDIQYEAEAKHAKRFKDNSGEHIVIASETGMYQNPKFEHENEGFDAELVTWH